MNMKQACLTVLIFTLVSTCFGQRQISDQKFDQIALVNKIDFINPKFNQARFGCGFLLKYKQDTFAVTAKHLLKFIKSDQMKGVTFEHGIKEWSLYSLPSPEKYVVVDRLVNENKNEAITEKSVYDDDWLVFSVKNNHTDVKVLNVRETPLTVGEKLYVVGWTRKTEEGEQRVYEFKYYKTIGKRILLQDIIVPEQFGGLSGAPVVDNSGKVVGIVSGKTTDPDSKKSYFSPCTITSLTDFLSDLQVIKP